MKQFFLQFFTWWNGQTLGTRLFTWRQGERVGRDEQGNVYYRSRGGKKDPALGHERRWVIYNGESDASRVPAGWHGWLHHRVDLPPSRESYQAKEWQLPHTSNMTGTAEAWRPKASLLNPEAQASAAPAYAAWKPDQTKS